MDLLWQETMLTHAKSLEMYLTYTEYPSNLPHLGDSLRTVTTQPEQQSEPLSPTVPHKLPALAHTLDFPKIS